MEALIDKQQVQRELLLKCITNTKKVAKEFRTKAYYQRRLKQFEDLWRDFDQRHTKILMQQYTEKAFDASKCSYFVEEVYDKVEEYFMTNVEVLEEYIEKLTPSTSSGESANLSMTSFNIPQEGSRNVSSIKLPKLAIPKFCGDYKRWTTFHDLFRTMIHENSHYAPVQKLQYLKLLLEGEPESLISHLQISDENYNSAWALLQERYDNKKTLVNSQLETLFNQPVLTTETARGIRQLLDTTTECMLALSNLKVDVTSWDPMINYFVVKRLPSTTHQLWEQRSSEGNELPTWKALQDFLKTRFRTLEAIASKGTIHTRTTVRPDHRKTYVKSYHITTKSSCPLCSQQHNLRQCPAFLASAISRKMEIVRVNGRCINCLGYGHMAASCPSEGRCRQCRQRHHTLLHGHQLPNQKTQQTHPRGPVGTTIPNQNQPTTSNEKTPTQTTVSVHLGSCDVGRNRLKHVLLATAVVRVVAPNGREQIVRALIDPGSQVSFISETITQDLHLNKTPIDATITTILEMKSSGKFLANFSVTPLNRHDCNIEVFGLVVRRVSEVSATPTVCQQEWTHLNNLELADPNYYRPGRIDVLLGAEVYGKIILEGLIKGPEGSPIAQRTIMGWILSGETSKEDQTSIDIHSFHVCADLDQQLKRFWEIEELQEKPFLNEEETECETLFQSTTRRRSDGRYEIQLPLKAATKELHLGKSRNIAVSRLLQMERRFTKDSKFKEEYHKCISEYLSLGHMDKVTSQEDHHQRRVIDADTYTCCYLPHHGVVKESSTTTKLRVVFDASRPTDSGTALNDMMLKGPIVQDDLTTLLIRWRKHRIAFTADLEKMYRQIRVREADTEYQRIVWRDSPQHPIKDYKLQTVTFGTKSAPYLATRVLKQLAIDERDNYPKAADVVLSDFYVDDLLSGSSSVEEALPLQQQLLSLMSSGGFSLRKWSSNCKEILETLPSDYCELNLQCDLSRDEHIRALGTIWRPAMDTLSYTYVQTPAPTKWTKRSVLSEVSKLFDPLGLLAPIILQAKLLIQHLWLKGLDWDEEIPHDIKSEWLKYRNNLSDIAKININRWAQYTNANMRTELHGFSDASTKAYAAAVYLCITDEQGNRHTTLLAAKTKVAPIKTITLPRLELCAASLLAKLMQYVKTALKLEGPHTTHAWTDSEIVIAWLRGHPSNWKTFIANRVSCIHEVLGKNVWRHVPSKQNPADCASRGINPSELSEYSLWWNGPDWLRHPENQWPTLKEITATALEQRRTANLVINANTDAFDIRCSSLTKLLRVTAYCLRFIFNARQHMSQRKVAYLKKDELDAALQYWLKRIQELHFSNEINTIQQQRPLPRQSRLLKLHPFLDEAGILRVGGRLRHSELPYNEKFPIILPDKGHFTTLLINKVHRDTMHGGQQLMMQTLLQNYWVLNARNTIRLQIHKCLICYKQRMATQKQLMGDLPAPRVRISRPFSHSGVDYCGPFELKTHKGRKTKTYKAYIAIFVCMATKALHMELVTDLSTEGFIAAFRRFTSRRGMCSDLYCDCGTNFVGASRVLKIQQQQCLSQLNDEIGQTLANDGVTFHFIPPSSPHFGGLWEAGVKSTKYHIKRVIGKVILTYEEFTTTLTQIEACLNSRPLSEISADPRDFTPLTPAHFLIGGSLLAIPEPSLLKLPENRLNRWQLAQRLMQTFWKRWSTEYLNRLQQRPKWHNVKENMKPGELVLIKEDNLAPCHWALGRIVEVHQGQDNLVRVVSVKFRNKILKRPITKICKLPFKYDEDNLILN